MLRLFRVHAWRQSLGLILAAVAALAGTGQPSPWQLGLQGSASPVMDSLVSFHNFLLVVITLIAAFVLALLVVVIVKFNARANPTPTRTTHNTLLEVLWTVVPVVILVVIAIPSFRLLFYQLDIPPADVTIKATGKQWYWTYTYPDHGPFEFDSLMLQDADRKKLNPMPPRLLAVDNAMVVPVNKVVRVQTIGVRRDPRLRGAVIRRQDRRHSRPPQRDLVQGDPGGRLLRPVLRAVRQGPRLHADRGAGGERAGVRRLGRGGEGEICRAISAPRRTRSRPPSLAK